MSFKSYFAFLVMCWCACTSLVVNAAEKVTVGIVGPFSGPYAATGVQFKQGIESYVSKHGTTVGGREVEIVYRDVGGTNPAAARQLAEELIVKNKAQILGGFYLSPEASAVSSLVTDTKTPTVLFVAASPPVIRQSPYFVRVSATMWHNGMAAAEFGVKKGAKTAYILVSDYSAGRDIQEAFTKRFTTLGGKVVKVDRVPLNTVDYAAFAQRIADVQPDMVQMFLPAGAPAIGFLKAMGDRGLLGGKMLVIGNNETDDPDLKLFTDSVVGTYTTSSYASAHKSPLNEQFKKDLLTKYGPTAVPNFSLVGAYDGMAVIYRMIEAQKGKPWNPDAAMAAAVGYTFESPSGPVKIDTTRNMTQNIFIRQVAKENGQLVNAIVEQSRGVPDPWSAANPP